MYRQLTYICGRGRCRVFCRVFNTGAGCIVHLMGGTKPHVGAVALGIPRLSLKGRGRSATTSVLTVLNHKDDELARPAAADLAAGYNCPVVVIAGVHIDDARPEELALIQTNACRAVRGVLKIGQGRRRGN